MFYKKKRGDIDGQRRPTMRIFIIHKNNKNDGNEFDGKYRKTKFTGVFLNFQQVHYRRVMLSVVVNGGFFISKTLQM